MKVKLFGTFVKEYEEKLSQWFVENKNLEVRHMAVAMNQAGDWILTVLICEEKVQPGEASPLLVENGT